MESTKCRSIKRSWARKKNIGYNKEGAEIPDTALSNTRRTANKGW